MKFFVDTQGFSFKNKEGNQYVLRYKNFYTSEETYIPKSFKSKYPYRYLNILRKARKYFKDIKTRYFIINEAIQKEKKKLGIKTKKTKEPKKEPKKDELKQYTTRIGLWKVAEKEKKRRGQIILMRELSYTIHCKESDIQKMRTFGQITINNRRLIDTADDNNGRDQYKFYINFLTPSDNKELAEFYESWFRYVSLDSFSTVTDDVFAEEDEQLHASRTCDMIKNNAIDYEGKSLNEMIKNNQLSQKLKENACVYTTLIQYYPKLRLDGEKLTYETLFKFFHQREYKEGDSLGLSMNEMKKFFNHFNLSCTLLNGENKIIHQSKRETARKDIMNHFKAIVTNSHLYPFTNKLNKFNSRELEEIQTSENYYLQTGKKKNELFIKEKEELLSLKFKKREYYIVYYSGNLIEVLKWLKYTLKYHPSVIYKKNLTNIYLKINESIANITNHDISFNNEQTEVRVHDETTSIENMKLFKNLDKEFADALLCKQYMSTYSESLQYNLFNFPVSCATGFYDKKLSVFDEEDSCDNPEYAIDFTKAYPSILFESKFIPVATPFDEFKKYNNEGIKDQNIYIIDVEMNDANKILSDSNTRVIYGINLKKIQKYQNYEIKFVCELNRVQKNTMIPKAMEKIKNSGLSIEDWKFIFNKNIGMTGKRFNQSAVSGLYDKCSEAKAQLKKCSRDFPKHIRDTKMWYIEHKGERKQLQNGFYLIQALIYDTMRTKLFIMFNELKEQGIEVTAVKTDCLYTSTKPDLSKLSFKVGKEFGCIKDIEEKAYAGGNEISFHDNTKECCEKCKKKFEAMNIDELKPKYKKKVKFNKLEIEDEFKLENFKVLQNKTLIRAELPGAGKTTNTIKYFRSQNKKIIAVSPTNALALDIQDKFKKNVTAITFCKMAGIIVGEDKTKKKFDLKDHDVILIDEIYSLSTSHLWDLKKIMDENKEKIFIGAGDSLQNCPIEPSIKNTKIYNEIIEEIFPNHLTLKESRRIRNPIQKERLLKMKEYIFTNFDKVSKRELIHTLQNEFKLKVNQKEKFIKCYNIGYRNETCDTVCKKILEKKKDAKKISAKRFDWFENINCFVKKRFRFGTHIFQVNYTYKIIELNKKDQTVVLEDVLTLDKFKINVNILDINFRPAYAWTGHSIQGCTTDKQVCIFDSDYCFTTARWLWTAITRTTDLNKVTLFTNDKKLELKYDFDKMISRYRMQDSRARREHRCTEYITKNYILHMFKKQNGTCIDCEQAFNVEHILDDNNNLTVDRIDSKISHVIGNCELRCVKCNVAKRDN